MPPKRRIQKRALKLGCEWASCQESFSQMEPFCKHVEDHLTGLNQEEEAEAGEFTSCLDVPQARSALLLLTLCFGPEERSCLWRDCGFCSVDGFEELRRHVLFHCCHTKLKQLGQQVLDAQPELGSCSMAFHNRNIIPEIPDNFICLWQECEVRLKDRYIPCSGFTLFLLSKRLKCLFYVFVKATTLWKPWMVLPPRGNAHTVRRRTTRRLRVPRSLRMERCFNDSRLNLHGHDASLVEAGMCHVSLSVVGF